MFTLNKTKLLFLCIIIGIIFITISSCSLPRLPRNYYLRPIRLQVIDANSKIPLKNIPVYQIIDTEIYGGCLSIFVPDCPNGTNYFAEYRVTDQNGWVSFPSRKINLTCKEFISHEQIIINLDLRPERFKEIKSEFSNTPHPMTKESALIQFGVCLSKERQRENLMTINNNYRGYLIIGGDYEMGPEWWHGRETIFDVVTNSKGLLQKEQKIVVPLDPQTIE